MQVERKEKKSWRAPTCQAQLGQCWGFGLAGKTDMRDMRRGGESIPLKTSKEIKHCLKKEKKEEGIGGSKFF